MLVLQKISGNLSRLPIEAAAEVSTEKAGRIARLPAGQAWAASAIGAAGTATVSRSRSPNRGHGIRLLNESPSGALRAGVKAAKDYLYLHAADLVGARNPKGHELTVEVHPLNGSKLGVPFGVGLLLAFCSSLLKKQLRGGLVIVGELAGDAIKSVQQPAEFVETAVREGARAILMPVSCRRALLDVSDEIATRSRYCFMQAYPMRLRKRCRISAAI